MSGSPVRLDCRGARCPQPVIRLARTAAQTPAGGLIELVADDPAAQTDVPAWCRMRGHDLVEVRAAEDGTALYVVRISPPPTAEGTPGSGA